MGVLIYRPSNGSPGRTKGPEVVAHQTTIFNLFSNQQPNQTLVKHLSKDQSSTKRAPVAPVVVVDFRHYML